MMIMLYCQLDWIWGPLENTAVGVCGGVFHRQVMEESSAPSVAGTIQELGSQNE